MPRFLIEVPHEEEIVSCAKAIRLLFSTGSHFLTHADFGCSDGEHKAWVIVDLDSREEARSILPPDLRQAAKITQLSKFSMEQIDAILKQHNGALVKPGTEQRSI